MTRRTILKMASTIYIVLGVLLMGVGGLYAGYAFFAQNAAASTVAEPEENIEVAAAEEERPALELPERLAWNLLSGSPQRVIIPDIQVDAPVVEVSTTVDWRGELVWEVAAHAAGHHQGTAYPSAQGNVVISGHISSPIRQEGNVFSRLPELDAGDQVMVQTDKGTFTYEVFSKQVVEPTYTSVMNPTKIPIVTLITCYPDLIYSHRMVITARLVSATMNADGLNATGGAQ